jgi:mannose-6-phosphate isomerase
MHFGISKLENPIRHYAWGSREFIARLQMRPTPSVEPEAELWIGDHPRAPSIILGEVEELLPDCIRRDPEDVLGRRCVERFGPSLPFLTKVLAATSPLSLQVHPDSVQARKGFEAEERAGIGLSDARRSYSDPRRKIELLIALEPMSALCGFRTRESTTALLDLVESEVIDRLLGDTPPDDAALSAHLFFACRTLSLADRVRLLKDLSVFARREYDDLVEARWVERLTTLYPADPGAIGPLLLNMVLLVPGESLFIRPGVLHSYLDGSGVEVMSSSDNVVRGGLTPKHVDEDELRILVARDPIEPRVISPEIESAGIVHYALPETEVDEFSVRVLSPQDAGGEIVRDDADSAKIILCVEGSACLSSSRDASDPSREQIELRSGEAAWVPASVGEFVVSSVGPTESATLYEITNT